MMALANPKPADDFAVPAAGSGCATGNLLIARLSPAVWSDVRSLCDRVDLEPGQRLFGADQRSPQLYFPDSGAIGLIACLPDGHGLQIALVDRHGAAGLPALAGHLTMPFDAIVQLPGTATRMRAEAFDHLRRDAGGHALLCTYLYSLAVESIHSALCNAFHTVEQRCARWLLMLSDLGGDEFFITQEHLSTMLGVRRPSVTMGALALQQQGAIRYRYGRMAIDNRAALEQSACECYHIVRDLRSRPV
jgi:CRP-like cAMP-binding protein